MNLIVFGPTGEVGKQLVKQALYKGHHVKAYGRNVFTEDLPQNDNLELIQGALFDEGPVFKAIKGCDAVLSALSGSVTGTDVTRSLGIKNMVAQMQKVGVKTIVALGGYAVLNGEDDTMIMDAKDFPPEEMITATEHNKAYQILKGSATEWVFVCPESIKDAEVTGRYITRADHLPDPNTALINSGDIALFMLNELEKKEYVKHRVGICN